MKKFKMKLFFIFYNKTDILSNLKNNSNNKYDNNDWLLLLYILCIIFTDLCLSFYYI